jgi:dipeptidase E
VATRQIVAMGGRAGSLEDFVLEIARGPKLCFLPTAQGDNPEALVLLYEQLGHRCRPTHVRLFGVPPADLRNVLLEEDVIYVAGGNTANMLATWRVHGLAEILRDAWDEGIVLCGWSAGGMCWFEGGVTDSFGPKLVALDDGLGFLGGSFCPHYDGEEQRRPVYRRLVADRFLPAGYGVDDGAALHYIDAELAEVVSAREGATAYRVDPDGESVLEARVLAGERA